MTSQQSIISMVETRSQCCAATRFFRLTVSLSRVAAQHWDRVSTIDMIDCCDVMAPCVYSPVIEGQCGVDRIFRAHNIASLLCGSTDGLITVLLLRVSKLKVGRGHVSVPNGAGVPAAVPMGLVSMRHASFPCWLIDLLTLTVNY